MFGSLQRRDVTLILMLLITGIVVATGGFFGTREFQRQMLEELGEAQALRWGTFMRNHLSDVNATLSYGKISEEDQELINLISEAGGVFRYKFFSKDGFIVVASRLEDIGLKNTKPYFQGVVAQGNTFVKIERPDSAAADKSDVGAVDFTVVEAYVPIMENGQFLGAVEIYVDATEVAGYLRSKVEKEALVGLGLLFALLYIAVGFVLYQNIRDRNRQLNTLKRAHESMARAEEEVLQLNQDLEARVDERTAELAKVSTEIKKVNEELEKRVEERTQQLFERTEQLYKTNDQLYKANESVSKLNLDLEARVEQRTAELAKATDDVKRLNAELEQRVEERTEELRAAQNDLLRNERMAALGQLTATVSHELRNPLGAIRTAVYLIGTRVKEKGLGVENALDRADRSIQRCDNIISELLDYTRQTELARETCLFDDWLKQVLMEQDAPAGIAVYDQLATPTVETSFDQDRLRRVVINLFNNACEAMKEDADKGSGRQDYSLTVSSRVVGDKLEVLFRDTGPGIPQEVLAKIFEPLFSTKSFGVGLGLPTVRQIMEQHEGGIEITSEVGQGTSVLFWLPIKRADERAA